MRFHNNKTHSSVPKVTEDSFVVHLFSNANLYGGEKNYLDFFSNYLAQPLKFPREENWGVCLLGLYMSHSPNLQAMGQSGKKDNVLAMLRSWQLSGSNTVKVHLTEVSPDKTSRIPLSIHTRNLSQLESDNIHIFESEKLTYFRLECEEIQKLSVELTTINGGSLKLSSSQPTIVSLKFIKNMAKNIIVRVDNENEGVNKAWANVNTLSDFRVAFPTNINSTDAFSRHKTYKLGLKNILFEPYFLQFNELVRNSYIIITRQSRKSGGSWDSDFANARKGKIVAHLKGDYGTTENALFRGFAACYYLSTRNFVKDFAKMLGQMDEYSADRSPHELPGTISEIKRIKKNREKDEESDIGEEEVENVIVGGDVSQAEAEEMPHLDQVSNAEESQAEDEEMPHLEEESEYGNIDPLNMSETAETSYNSVEASGNDPPVEEVVQPLTPVVIDISGDGEESETAVATQTSSTGEEEWNSLE